MIPSFDLLILFLLILVRISAFLVAAPFFSLKNFPTKAKVGLALGITVVLVPLVPAPETQFSSIVHFALAISKEVMVGLAMGFICTLIFSALSVGGQLIDIKIGFFASQMFDPMTGAQVTIISRFFFLLGIAFLLATNTHHDLIAILAKSFEAVPVTQATAARELGLLFIRAFADMMVLALKIAAPIMAVTLAIDVSLGLVGRTAPQMNIFMLGFPLKIVVGIFTLSILVPVMGSIFSGIFDLMEQDLLLLLKGLT
ncbi:MAG: flagellar type III secretion system protein FliR [Firmicutes bacterium]|nr:flagellar type III secretion system protein FliR [Bacillota bacterium]